jgi:hypothetical protein
MSALGLTIIGVAIAAVTLAVIAIPAWRRHQRNKKPFKCEYSIVEGHLPMRSRADVELGRTNQGFDRFVSSRQRYLATIQSRYSIYLLMHPQQSCTVTSVELRFVPECAEQPEVNEFQDVNPQAQIQHIPSFRRANGILLSYNNGLPVNRGKNAKTEDYFAQFTTKGLWDGGLNMRVSMSGIDDVFLVSVPCSTKCEEKGEEDKIN